MLNIIKVLQGASKGAERANLHDGRTEETTNRNASKFGRSINLNFQPFFFSVVSEGPGATVAVRSALRRQRCEISLCKLIIGLHTYVDKCSYSAIDTVFFLSKHF